MKKETKVVGENMCKTGLSRQELAERTERFLTLNGLGYSRQREDDGTVIVTLPFLPVKEERVVDGCSDGPCTEKRKGLKAAKVHYRKTGDGRIEIVKFENVASLNDIEEVLGKDVAGHYLSQKPYFYNAVSVLTHEEVVGVFACVPSVLSINCFAAGNILSREEFSSLIAIMKAAGSRLHRICEEEAVKKESEVKVITI